MKKFLALLFFVAAMFTMQAQTNIATAMSNPTNVDSATVKYISTSAPLPGLLNRYPLCRAAGLPNERAGGTAGGQRVRPE